MKFLFLFFAIVFSFAPTSGQEHRDTLLVGYTLAPPFIIQNGDELEGLNIWLWNELAKDLNIPHKMVRMDFAKMLQAVKAGSIDVSINPLTITSDRSKKMEFTHSFFASNSTVAIGKVSGIHRFTNWFKAFFNANFLRGLMALLIFIFMFGLAGWFFERKNNPKQFRPGREGIWDGFWWSVVTLTTVGYGDKSPKSKRGKITALILMFSGLLFISGLTASIASNLTVNQLNSDSNSFASFKDQKVGSVKNTSTTEFLKSHFFKDIRLFSNVSEGLTELQKNNLQAVMYDEPILKYRIKQDSTLKNIKVLPVKFDIQFYAFALVKERTELEQRLSQKILEIMETPEWQVVLSEYGLTEF